MKRILSMALSAALMLSLGAPAAAKTAAAAESPVPSESAASNRADADQRLAQVTAKVKGTLSIGDEYEEFYGDLRENELAPVWNLNWSGNGVSLAVEATEDGKILSYYLSEESGSYDAPSAYGSGSYIPAFPAVSREQAQKSAEAFLKKVLDPSMETARFSDRNTGRLSTSSHRFGGDILLNGVSSPLTFSMTVRASDGKVIRFYRESLEQSVIGGIPGAKPAVKAGAAGEQLKGTMKMRLEYVLDPDTSKASLQYLPETTDSYYVDAQTGTLVNLTKLYAEIDKKGLENGFASDAGAAPEASMDTMAGGGGLSQAELTGISKLEGVLDKETLDKSVRKLAALGLDKYAFGSANYSLNKETEQVTVRLTYSRKDGDNIWRRTVVCDGKTGALLRVSSSAPYTKDRKAAVSEEAARKTGETFLTELWGEDFAKTALYNSTPWQEGTYSSEHSFQFSQKENGYFFPENSLRVSVDITDGTISGLDRSWTDDVSFDSPEGILDAAAGLDAWFGHYTTALAYRNIPVRLDPSMPEAVPLLKQGYAYFFHLKLSYALEEDKYASGVDAKTGKVVYRDIDAGEDTLSYSDTADHWAKEQIEALASYGIGWSGGTCQPRKELTQLDLVALLASADGYRYDPETSKADDLYSHAYSLGMLQRAQRQDERVMTRGETVRMLLSGAGFGPVARLQGIFTCSYADRDQIPAELLSWAALAQGLGMVSAEGSFDADRTATRAEAAVMLYNLMNR